MIPKKVKKASGNFKTLALYIAAAKETGEKLEDLWIENCLAGDSQDDLDLAIHEVYLTQGRNHRAKTNKNYHLIISFPEGETPSPTSMRDIERELATALGFGEHQRIIATHKNTDNYHMHVAINMVHPETFKMNNPAHDYRILNRVCREMELKHGLTVDNGIGESEKPTRKTPGAKDMEAHRWEQSFEGFVQDKKDTLLASIKTAESWQDVHRVFAAEGLKIKPHGNGLVISQDKQHMKASSLHRSLSKNALEKRLGKFQHISRQKDKTPRTHEKYDLKPLSPLRNAAQRALWSKFRNRKKNEPLLSWKDYLMLEAGFDPLAMVIIKANKAMIRGVFGQSKGSHSNGIGMD